MTQTLEYNLLQQHFDGLSTKEIQILGNYFSVEELQKGAYYTKEGQLCQKMSIVSSGLLRFYALRADGREITQWIAPEDHLVTEISGFFFDQPNRWSIQAYEPTRLLSISKSDYQVLSLKLPTWNAVEKQLVTACFMQMENRIFSHLAYTAEERYRQYFAQYGTLFNRAPLQHIASVLGMTPETLSRIRAAQLRSKS